jgi:hypothetical protein
LAQETDEANSFSKERTMKVSNNQKSEKTDDGVSRDTLNDWQRKDAAKNAQEAKHRDADPKDAGKQAEG